MKSAIELAMERAGKLVDEKEIRLSPEQKAKIEEIRKFYEAKWAEQEIALNGRMRKLAKEEPKAFAENRGQLQREINQVREQLFAERDAKIEAVRKGE